jgi:tyrosyl-tRNA synthetase
MATDTKNVDLLQKFIDNEKNAKTWTLISVTLFCLLAFGLIFLAWKLKTAKTTISSQEKVINELLIKSDSLNDILSAQNNNWEKNYANYDSLQNITNSLLINLAELKKEKPDENVISQNSALIDKPTQEKIEKLILPSNIEKIQDKESRYTVYIQFAEGYKEQAIKLQRSWQKEYICPQPELITNRSFASTVNYFYPEDEEEARKLAKFTEVKINSPVRVNALKMKAPKKQLELWLGKYQPRTTEQIIQKYEKKSMN